MTVFWILAAGLAGLALLFTVTPLVSRRTVEAGVDQNQLNLEIFRSQLAELDADLASGKLDQSRYDAARHDLERELLADVDGGGAAATGPTGSGRWMALALGLAVPAAAVGLYLAIGHSAIIPRLEAIAASQGEAAGSAPAGHPAAGGQQAPPIDVLVERLAQKMEEHPGNVEGWMMLGRTYLAMGRNAQAASALERAYRLAPGNPDVTVAYAQAVAAGQGGELAGRPAELIRGALAADPNHLAGRWLEGMVAYQQERFSEAAVRWEALLATLSDSQTSEAEELRQAIAEARGRAGGGPTEPAAPEAPAQAAAPAPVQAADTRQPAVTGASVTVQVSLAEPLWSRASVNDTVYVYAKANAGPPMPLAVQRVRVDQLPATITLDDSMAMMPAMRLSAFPQVLVGARISRSGQATPQSGDLEGEVGPIAAAGQAGPVAVVIDRVRP